MGPRAAALRAGGGERRRQHARNEAGCGARNGWAQAQLKARWTVSKLLAQPEGSEAKPYALQPPRIEIAHGTIKLAGITKTS